MTALFMRPVRQLAQALTTNDSPRALAAGFTLGMLIGLVPKGNLVALMLMFLLCGLRVSKPAGLLAIGLFSLIGFALDGTAHQLGSLVLVWEPLRPLHTWIYEQPFGPWLALNNTVVLGQLLIGLYLAYPTFWLSLKIISQAQPKLSKWLLRYKIIRWLRGAELGTHWGADA